MSAEVAAAIKRLFDTLDVDPPRMSWKNAWASAARELGRTISPTEYDSAVLALVQERFLAARGAGAQTPLVRRATGPPVTPERDLMPGVEEWLREVWLPGFALPSAEIIDRIVEDTSRAREHGAGPNSQPDFLAMFLCERRTKLVTRYLDVASFEVKAANANIPAAAQQAQNHHNFVNRSYLIWPAPSDALDLIDDLTRACTTRRIGLIAFFPIPATQEVSGSFWNPRAMSQTPRCSRNSSPPVSRRMLRRECLERNPMTGKLVCVANRKGGVGKTTTAIVLAQSLQTAGHSVVVVDVDPQGSATYALASDDFRERLTPLYL